MSVSSFTRRQFVRLATIAGAVPLAVPASTAVLTGLATAVTPAVALAAGTPFANGIDASTYTGGDRSCTATRWTIPTRRRKGSLS
jgi:hypothetical protein